MRHVEIRRRDVVALGRPVDGVVILRVEFLVKEGMSGKSSADEHIADLA